MLPRITEQYHNDWYHPDRRATSEVQVQIGLNPEDQRFVSSVEDFLTDQAHLMSSRRPGAFLRALGERGWSVPRWPQRWGGAALSPHQSWLLDRTLSLHGATQLDPVQVDLVGPLLMVLADAERLDDWLPAIARGESRWAVHASLHHGSPVAGVLTGDRFLPAVDRLTVRGAAGALRLLLLARGDSMAADIVSAELPAANVIPGAFLDPDQVDTLGLVFERLNANPGERELQTLLERWRTGDALSARNQSGRLRFQFETLRSRAGAAGYVPDTTLADLSVALLALEALENRAQNTADESLTLAVTIAGATLGRQLLAATIEALGYYALPAPDPGLQHNELPALAMAGQDAIGELIRYVGGLEEVAARDRVSALASGAEVGVEAR